MNGKSKCKILKDIRRQIAQENDITLVTSECKYQGDCSGTCPKCEAEVFFLEQELEKRRKTGKKVVLAGIAAATIVGIACCGIEDSDPEVEHGGTAPYQENTSSSSTENMEVMGEYPETYPSDQLDGEPVWDETEPSGDELVGDIALPEPGIDDGDWGALH